MNPANYSFIVFDSEMFNIVSCKLLRRNIENTIKYHLPSCKYYRRLPDFDHLTIKKCSPEEIATIFSLESDVPTQNCFAISNYNKILGPIHSNQVCPASV